MKSDIKKDVLNLDGYKRHILFCGGPSCCLQEQGDQLWDYLKKTLKDSGLCEKYNAQVFRTKTKCLRVCSDGPIALVYPEGTWYRLVDQKAIDEIIEQHLKQGIPVSKYSFARSACMASKEKNG